MLSVLFVAALAGTIFPLTIFPNGDFLLGSIAVLLIVRLHGTKWGVLAALLSGSYITIVLQNPFVAIIWVVEALVVGMFLRRGMKTIVLADIFFWIFFGAPLWCLIYLQVEIGTVLPELVQRSFNGIINALVATLILFFFRRVQRPTTISLWETEFNLLVACFLLPSLLVILINLQGPHDILKSDMEAELVSKCLAIESEMASLQERLKRGLSDLAQFAAQAGVGPTGPLQQRTHSTLRALPEFLQVYVADARGKTVASFPLASELGKPLVGKDFSDRGYYEQLKDSMQPVTTDVKKDSTLPLPHISLAVPIIQNGRFAGYTHGALDVRPLRKLLENHAEFVDYHFVLIDRQDRVVASSDHWQAMESFSRREERKYGLISTDLLFWQSRDKQLVFLPPWRTSLRSDTLSIDLMPWRLVLEMTLPVRQGYLQRQIINSMGIMFFPAVLALFFARLACRKVTDPIRALAKITSDLPEKIKNRQELVWPIEIVSEVNSLVSNFKSTAVALETNYQELEALNEASEKTLDRLLTQHKWEDFLSTRTLQTEINQRRRIEELLDNVEAAETKYRFLVENTLVGVYIIQGDRFSYVNPRFAELFGCPEEELLQNYKPLDLVHPEDKVFVSANIGKQMRGEADSLQYQYRGVRKDGNTIYVEVLSGKGIYNGQTAILGTLLDISDRTQAEERFKHLAFHDPLTELPNRLLFSDRVEQALAHAVRNKGMVAFLFLDLDRFKAINDSLGHVVGDQILKEVANRLIDCLRETDTVSRFGGDEFNLLLPQTRNQEDAALVAHKILRTLEWPFQIEEHELFVTCSIGIALYPQNGMEIQTLIKNADTALHRAKDLGRNNYQFYSSEMHAKALERMAMESSLRRVFELQELRIHYQPQVNLRTGKIAGVEALVRWEHPTGELISPSAFIPLAEETGLIIPIGEWVLRTACFQAKAWQDEGLTPLRLGVNVSACQFQGEELAGMVIHVLRESGIAPQWLNLEVTESVVMHNVKQAIITLCELQDVGITISIDDFGVGFSSLSYLKDFPADHLKIDRSFVRNLPQNASDANIAKHLIEMAHGLGKQVIAEGVETLEQLIFLRSLGCDEIKGFLFSRPLPPDELAQLLREEKPFSL